MSSVDLEHDDILSADPAAEESTAAADAMVLRHPGIPTTVDELAAMKGAAMEVLDARVQVLATARAHAIRMTADTDWVLYKMPDGSEIGYLQDAGCDRVRDILGVEIFRVSTPEKILTADGKSFMYVVTGWGRSRLTKQTVEAMEGGRQSDEKFCQGKTGAELELLVRKAARANLDGNITRELTGLKSVPITDLIAAWAGTGKDPKNCHRGAGYGTAQERYGGVNVKEPAVPPPSCEICGATAIFRSSADGGFYSCPDWKKHESRKWSINAQKWVKQSAAAREPGGEG